MKKVEIDKNYKELLKRDAVSEAESVFKKSYTEFTPEESSMMFASAYHMNQNTKNYLKGLGDTHFGISWNEFKNIIESYGFILGLKYDFQNESYTDEAVLYYYPQKGLVIWATSYGNKESLNGGTLYGEVKATEKVEFEDVYNERLNVTFKEMRPSDKLKKGIESLRNCSHNAYRDIETGIRFSYDVREALINTIEEIGENLEMVKVWNEKPFLWFLDYKEDKVPGYNNEELTKEKIRKCPLGLQKMLGVYMKGEA